MNALETIVLMLMAVITGWCLKCVRQDRLAEERAEQRQQNLEEDIHANGEFPHYNEVTWQ